MRSLPHDMLTRTTHAARMQVRRMSATEQAAHDVMATYGLAPRPGTCLSPRSPAAASSCHSPKSSSGRMRPPMLSKARSFEGISSRPGISGISDALKLSPRLSDPTANSSSNSSQVGSLPLLPKIRVPPPTPEAESALEPPTPTASQKSHTSQPDLTQGLPEASCNWDCAVLDGPRVSSAPYRPSPLGPKGRRASDSVQAASRFLCDTARDMHSDMHMYLSMRTQSACAAGMPGGGVKGSTNLSWSGTLARVPAAAAAAAVRKQQQLGDSWVQSLQNEAMAAMQPA